MQGLFQHRPLSNTWFWYLPQTFVLSTLFSLTTRNQWSPDTVREGPQESRVFSVVKTSKRLQVADGEL